MNPSSGNVGSIEYTARIDTKQLKSDARQVERISATAAKDMGDNLEKGESRVSNLVGNVLGKVKAAAIATGVAIGAATTAATVFGLKSAADFEQTRIGLENMLGSADKARDLLGDISKFAAETPFEFPELAQATRQLVAFGFTGEDAFKTMKQLGDVSAAVGAPINDLAYLMGTLRTQGRAFTIDIRQFAQRGIPIYEYLGKVLGVSEQKITEMIEAGKIGFPEVQKAFQAMTGEGGKFYKTMDKQSKSLSGQFSTLKDNLGQTLRELIGISKTGDIIKGSLFDRVTKGVGDLNASIPEAVEQLRQWAKSVGEVGSKIADYLMPKLKVLFDSFKDNAPAFKEFYEKILQPLAKFFGEVLVVALGFAIDQLNFMVDAWGKVLGAVNKVYDFFKDTFVPAMNTAGDTIVAKFNWVRDNFLTIVGEIIGFFATLPYMMPLYVAQAFALIVQKIVSLRWSDIFSGIWQGMQATWDKVTQIAVNAWHFIHNLKWSELFTGIGKSFANGLIDLIEGALRGALRGLPGNIEKRINLPRFAAGTDFAPGGMALVGERGPELVNLPRGSQVIPNNVTNDLVTGGNSTSVTVNLTMNGIMTRSKSDEREVARSLLGTINDELRAKGLPQLGGGAI